MSNKPATSSADSVPENEEILVSSSNSTPFAQLHRTLSHGSHQTQQTYFPNLTSPSRHPPLPVRHTSVSSGIPGRRSTSLGSSRATARGIRDHSGTLSEEDEESGEEGGDRGKAPILGQASSDEDGDTSSDREEDLITLKDRQSLINVEHPFGLPIWKPALYKKSRSVTRHADEALHSIPSAQAERHLLPGNIFWLIVFGWWLALSCIAVSAILYLVPAGGKRYSSLVFGLGWYVAWPFGKYVEGQEKGLPEIRHDEESRLRRPSGGSSDDRTIRGLSFSPASQLHADDTVLRKPQSAGHHSIIIPTEHSQSDSWNSVPVPVEAAPLLATANVRSGPSKSYGAMTFDRLDHKTRAGFHGMSADWFGGACFWLAFITIIAPLMLLACIACWGLVITIPMAKLNWALLKYMFERPTSLRFCAAPPAVVISSIQPEPSSTRTLDTHTSPQFSVKHPRLAAGQAAPSGSPSSTVLLCTYRAVGWQYYKYTVGGVNILFVNLLPIVFFVIFDGFVLLPVVERRERTGDIVPPALAWIASRALIFFLSLASVIPLSYFIGMAVASISAQSSIGMGAVINATFGSIIEIILYAIALTRGKGRLVEGSIVGSLLAGVLLMPGMSMCSGALRRKEQKFNAKSAGVTSMMLIMAIIGTLTPTLFYQTYGNVSRSNILCWFS
jgi:Ca2+:H+ antiporter